MKNDKWQMTNDNHELHELVIIDFVIKGWYNTTGKVIMQEGMGKIV